MVRGGKFAESPSFLPPLAPAVSEAACVDLGGSQRYPGGDGDRHRDLYRPDEGRQERCRRRPGGNEPDREGEPPPPAPPEGDRGADADRGQHEAESLARAAGLQRKERVRHAKQQAGAESDGAHATRDWIGTTDLCGDQNESGEGGEPEDGRDCRQPSLHDEGGPPQGGKQEPCCNEARQAVRDQSQSRAVESAPGGAGRMCAKIAHCVGASQRTRPYVKAHGTATPSLCISTPYARTGVLYDALREHHGVETGRRGRGQCESRGGAAGRRGFDECESSRSLCRRTRRVSGFSAAVVGSAEGPTIDGVAWPRFPRQCETSPWDPTRRGAQAMDAAMPSRS